MSILARLWQRWAAWCDLVVNGPRIRRYETDAEAIRADWEAVDGDLRAAMLDEDDEQWVDDDSTDSITALSEPVLRRDWDNEQDAEPLVYSGLE